MLLHAVVCARYVHAARRRLLKGQASADLVKKKKQLGQSWNQQWGPYQRLDKVPSRGIWEHYQPKAKALVSDSSWFAMQQFAR
jgi:hypothetical protein